ncbi:MAG TPA: RDD family protein [Blastocatellia bacterium]|jgi:uncharacterized RDD family membrane protein YckC
MGSIYRTFRPRFWAGVVDGIVFLPINFMDKWVYSNIRWNGVLVIWFVFASSLPYLYNVLMHGKYGQTVGKMVTKVKVVDVSLAKLSMRQAFLRDSVYIALTTGAIIIGIPAILEGGNSYQNPNTVSALILVYASLAWFVVELVTMLTNSKRRALHDFIAGSVVVNS